MASNDPSDLSDLPDVPDVPDERVDDGPMVSDDEAVKKINRRVSPVGWLGLIAVLGAGGATGYSMYQSAQHEAVEDAQKDRGRADLQAIIDRNLPPAETAAAVREVYQRYTAESVRQPARRVLAGLRDPQSVPMLIDGLAVPGAPRAQAAMGLAEIGMPHAEAARGRLLQILPTTEPTLDQVEVVWALVVVNEPTAWPKIRELLENGRLQQVKTLGQRNAFDPALVARVAGVAHLVELANGNTAAGRRLAALTLSELATPEVVEPLTNLVRSGDREAARLAAIGLGRCGATSAVPTLLNFLQGNADDRDGVLTALASSAGAQGLAAVIHGSSDLGIRSNATRLLRAQQDPDAGDALFEALQAATGTELQAQQMKRDAVFGLAEIGDPRAVDGLVQYVQYGLTHLDPNSTQEAKLALEQIRRIPGAATRAKDALVAVLRDPHSDAMRTPVLMALATAGDPSLGAQISPFLAQTDAQDGAAVALCMLRAPDCFSRVLAQVRMPAGLRMVEETIRDEPVNISRRNAIRALGWMTWGSAPVPAAGRAAAIRELRRIVEDANDRRGLREDAGYSLAAIADDATLTEIGTRATTESVPIETRLYYIYALRGRSTPQVANRLVEAYLRRGVNPDLMGAAAIAAGFGADDSTAQILLRLLEANENDGNLRFAVATAAILGGNVRTTQKLVDLLAGNDELAGTLRNAFAPRAAGRGGNETVQENWSLLPITRPMFEDGRIFRRVDIATILEAGRGNTHFSFALSQLTTRLKSGWENAQGMTAFEIRTALRDAALGDNAERRDLAFRALRFITDRGTLHSLRRQTRNPAAAERARRELAEMSGG